jgi:Leucine-rich repeat (LRR) protein
MKEFRINKYLSLKLEKDQTYIYVKGKRFLQCTYLLLSKKFDEIEDLSEIKSVDEISDYLDHSMEAEHYNIPSEAEFWAHCSNLQVWYENNYDTRLIHSNLAFPLLKELSHLGDSIALKVFKEEIAKRLESGYEPVIEYLAQEKYVDYLNREDFLSFLLECNEVDVIKNIEKRFDIKFTITYNFNDLPTPNELVIEKRSVTGINLFSNIIADQIEDIFKLLSELKGLTCLRIDNCNLTRIPPNIHKLNNLEYLTLSKNQISEIPESLGKINKLEFLDLAYNKISKIPSSLNNLTSLYHFDLRDNCITDIPNSLDNLKLIVTEFKTKD